MTAWKPLSLVLFAGIALAAEPDPTPAPEPTDAPKADSYPDLAAPGAPGEGEPAELGAAIEKAAQQYQDKVMVSSGARNQKLADVPMTLTYLSAEDIERTGQFTLCDTIQLFPGLECRRGAMRQATVSTRGLGFNFLSNRLLMLRDGRPETDPWTGSFLADESNPLTNVKQVEVIRGPGSSLYGSNAFAGVINYVTRNPDDLIKKGNNVGVDGRFLVSAFSTYRAQATAAAKVGDLKGLVNYYYGTSEGSPRFTDRQREIVDTQQWSRVHQVSAKAEYKVLKLDASYTDSTLAHPGGNPSAVVGNCGRCHYTARDSENIRAFNVQAVADVPLTSWMTVTGRAYFMSKRREATVENLITRDLIPAVGVRQRIGGDFRVNVNAGPLNVVAGGDVKLDEINTQNRLDALSLADMRPRYFGVYADAELKPTRRLILGAGVRYDAFVMSSRLWQNQAGELSPRASVVFHAMPSLTFRGNYGHAFRAPTPVELGIFQRMYASTLVGNPYLKSEALDTGELAIDAWPFGEVLRLTATGFYTQARNFINEVPLDSATAIFANVGNGRLAGVEMEAASQIPKINTSVNLSYQYLYTEMSSTRRGFEYAPSHRIQFRAHTAIGKDAFVDLFGAYVGPRADAGETRIALPGYLIASLRVGWNILDQLSISAGATNLFNTQYEETLGFPAQGTQLFSELKVIY